ncbi:MAG: hypothetical protein IT207_09025 [Fimbriimonadaceae bacterium]|nr:hypothetical protein [Fimbriimonadaceae bacterium]
MSYYVVWPDGRRFGPANLDTLNQWAGEGRISADALIEDVVAGKTVPATMVPGLEFPSPESPTAAIEPEAPPIPDPFPGGQSAAGWQQVQPNAREPGSYAPRPAPSLDPYATAPGASTPFPRGVQQEPSPGSANLNWAWALMAVGFLCGCGFVAHIPALFLAYQAKKAGHPSANIAVIIGWVMLFLSVGGLIVWVILAMQ